jgi:ribosome-associated protein
VTDWLIVTCLKSYKTAETVSSQNLPGSRLPREDAASIQTEKAAFMIRINERISIPENELNFTASHSSGPGGQNVNKVSSRVTLWFDVVNSPSLPLQDKERIIARLAGRIGKDGVLRVISQQTRSQAANRELTIRRLIELLRAALKQSPRRKKTRVSRAARLRRLEEKRQRSLLKKERSKRLPE